MRIHHREVPWSVIHGEADAALFFYHLARYTKAVFPEAVDLVPLGGTVDAADPLPGNRIGTFYAVRLDVPLTEAQSAIRDAFLRGPQSPVFTGILEEYGLRRPAAFSGTDAPHKEGRQ